MSSRFLQSGALLAILLALPGCASFTYYAQSVGGQLDVVANRQPIARLLRNPSTPPALKARLAYALDIRQFAVEALHLHDNASYRGYTDLHREYVVWNVVTTPPFSMTPRQWCFPVVGCVSYRGYFHLPRAEHFATALQQHGDDVAVIGVPAYSTLGWFADPVLSTTINWPKAQLAGLIFHELAHQLLYIKDDTAFNESFAVTVEEEGVRRWLEQRQDAAALAGYRADRRRHQQFIQLVMATQAQLVRLYAANLSPVERRTAKSSAFAQLCERYQRLRAAWGGYPGYDRWFARDLNNAHIAALTTYQEYVPAFRALLAQQQGDLKAFYAAARVLANLPTVQRLAHLRQLSAQDYGFTRSPRLGTPAPIR